MKTYLAKLAAVVMTLAIAAPANAEVFTSSYETKQSTDYELLTEMLIGPGVSRRPRGDVIWQMNDGQLGVFSNLVVHIDAAYTNAQILASFTNGVILSTGKISDGPSLGNMSAYDGSLWPDESLTLFREGDDDLDAYFEDKFQNEFGVPVPLWEPAGIILYVQPKYDTINVPFVMASEEFYFDSDKADQPDLGFYESYSDKFAFFLEPIGDLETSTNEFGEVVDTLTSMTNNIAKLPDGNDIEIAAVNQHTNSEYFVSNVATNENGDLVFPAYDINLPMEFNGAIVGPVAVAYGLDTNKVYKLKIIIADAQDNTVNSVVFLRERGITSGADLKIDVDGPAWLEVLGPADGVFTDTVSNIGPAIASGVEVKHFLPEGVDPASVDSINCSVGSVDASSFGVENGTNYFIWAIGDGFKPYDIATMSFKCTLPGPGANTNVASVATSTGDYDESNNTDICVTNVGEPPRLRVEAISTNKVYGTEITLEDLGFVLSIDGTNETQIVTGIDVTFTNALGEVAYPTNSAASAGTYGICLAGMRGFDLSYFTGGITYLPGTLEITPAEVTLTANSGTETYDGTEKTVTGYTCSVDGLTFDGVTASGSGTNVGTYDVTFTGVTIGATTDTTGNYVVTGTTDGLLTINAQPVTLTANSGTETYDGTEKAVTGYSCSVDGLTFDSVAASGSGTNVGAYDVTFTGVTIGTTTDTTGNYVVTDTNDGLLTITAQPVTLTANSGTETYDGTEKTVTGYTCSVNGLTFGGVTASGSGTDAGEYPVTFTGVTIGSTTDTTGNYVVTGTTDGLLTITAQGVTLTANSGTETYDGTEKTITGYTCSVDGLTFGGVAASGSGTNAGTYDVTFAGVTIGATKDTTGNYVVTGTTDGLLTITAQGVTLTANSGTETYDGTEKTVTGYTCSVDGLTFAGVTASGSGTNAGTYDVTFAGVTIGATTDTTGNYVVTDTNDGLLTITAQPVTLTANSGTETYDGTEKTVMGYSCSVDGLTFDSVAASGSGTNAGTYDVTFTGVTIGATKDTTGNYVVTDKTDGLLTITAQGVTLTANSGTETYDGTEKTVTGYTCSVDGLTFGGVTASGCGTDVGEYPVTFTGVTIGSTTDTTGNYVVTDKIDGLLTITAQGVTLIANSGTETYDGSEKTVTGYMCSVANLDFSGVAASGSGTNAGTYDVTFAGVTIGTTTDTTGNYVVTGTTDGLLTITAQGVTLTANSGTETYDGTEKTVTGYTCSVNGLTFGGVTASGSGTNAGTYDVTFAGVTIGATTDTTGNYVVTDTNDGLLTITAQGVTLTANSGTETYDGTEKTVTGYSCSVDGLTFDSVAASGSGTNAGTYGVTFTGVTIGATKDTTGNYVVTDTIDGLLTITAQGVTLTANSGTETYDGTEKTVTGYTCSVDGLTFGGVTASGSGTNAGTYDVTFTGVTIGTTTDTTGNYVVTDKIDGLLTITVQGVTLTANSGTETYDGSEKTVTGYTCSVANLDFAGVAASGSGTNAGTYDVTFAGVTIGTTTDSTGNYVVTGTTDGLLTITAQSVTLTANSGTETYDGTEKTVTGYSCSVDGLTFTGVAASGSGTDAGTYDVTFTGVTLGTTTDTTGNYVVTGTTDGLLTITKRALEVTASSRTKEYGQTLSFTGREFEITGGSLVGTDTKENMRVTLSSSKAADPLAAVGTYPGEITASAPVTGIVADNYEITFKPGDLTVTARRVEITAHSASKVYDGTALTTNGFDVAGLALDDAHVFTVAMTVESAITDVGTKPNVIWKVDDTEVTPGVETLVGNYLVTTVNGTLEVTPAAVTITAHDAEKVYDGTPLTTNGFDVVGMPAGVTHDFVVAMTAESTITDVGTQPNVIATVDGESVETGVEKTIGNYLVTTADGLLTVTRAGVTLTATSGEVQYNAEEQTISGYSCSVVGLTFDGVAASGSGTDAGTYDVTFTGVTLGTTTDTTGNYVVTGTADGTLTITKRALEVTASSRTKEYGQTLSFTGREFEITGGSLVGTDKKENMRVTLSSSKAADPLAAVGTYPGEITASAPVTGIVADNYEITFKPGDLTVTARRVEITAHSASKVYDGTALTTNGFDVAGLALDDAHVFTVAMTVESAITDVGTKPNVIWKVDDTEVTPGVETLVGNYLVTTVNGTLEVTPAAVTITAHDAEKVYDGTALTTNGFDVAGMPAGVTHDFVVAMTAESTITDVGTQPNVIATVDGESVETGVEKTIGNYLVTTADGLLTVTRAGVTLTATSGEVQYNAEEQTISGYSCSVAGLTFDGVAASGSGTNPGDYAVTFTGVTVDSTTDTTGNYVVTGTIDGTLTITKRDLEVTASSRTKEYGQTLSFTGREFEITGGSLVGTDTKESMRVTLASSKAADPLAAVGTYPGEITASAPVTGIDVDKYEITFKPETLTVTARRVEITAGDAEKVYDGTALTTNGFEVVGLALDDAHVFTVEMTADSTITNVGTQPNVIWKVDDVELTTGVETLVGNYLVTTVDGTLTVTAAPVTIHVAGDSDEKVYNGSVQSRTGTVTATSSDFELDASKFSYTGETSVSGKDVGEYTTALAEAECAYNDTNYMVTWEIGDPVRLRITPASMAITVNGSQESRVYTGAEQTYEGTVTATSADAGFDASKFSYTGAKTVAGTDVGNYSQALDAAECHYADANYSVDWIVGSPVSLAITPAELVIDVNGNGTSVVYNATEQVYEGTVTATSAGAGFDATKFSYTGDRTVAGTNVGTYSTALDVAACAYSDANYVATWQIGSPVSLEITPAPVAITAHDASKVYDGTALTTNGFDVVGLADSDTHEFAVEMTADSTITNVGTQPNVVWKVDDVEVTSGVETLVGNYLVTTVDGTLAVTAASVTIRVDGDSGAKVYNGSVQSRAGTVTATSGDFALDASKFSYTGDRTVSGRDVGEYTTALVAAACTYTDANYTVTWEIGNPIRLAITPAAFVITVNGSHESVVYNATEQTYEGTVTATSAGAGFDAAKFSYTGARTVAGTNVGDYETALDVATCAYADANYTVTWQIGSPVSLEITPAPVTITAHDASKVYDGMALTTNGFDVVGLADDDTHEFTVEMTADSTITNVGTQPNVVWKVDDTEVVRGIETPIGNYLVTTVDGTLAITAEAVTIRVDGDSGAKVYNGSVQSRTGTVTATSNDFMLDASKFSYTGDTIVSGRDVGEYTTALDEAACTYTDANYSVTWEIGNPIRLEITPAPVTLTAGSATKEYDGTELTEDGFDVEGLPDGDAHEFAVEMTADSTITNVGTQPNVIGAVDGVAVSADIENLVGNYLVTILPGTLTISASAVDDGEVEAEAELRTTISGRLNWDTGLIDLEFTIVNEGDGAVGADMDYWVELQRGPASGGVSSTYWLTSPTGTLPNGREYVAITDAVKAALRTTGNGDAAFDPGETVTVGGVSVYHWKRWSPDTFINPSDFLYAGSLAEATGQDGAANAAYASAQSAYNASEAVAVTDAPAGFTTKRAVYGALMDGGRPVAIVQFTVGAEKKGKCAVTGSVTGLDGKARKLKSAKVGLTDWYGEDVIILDGVAVKGYVSALSAVIGADGIIDGSMGAMAIVPAEIGATPGATLEFVVEDQLAALPGGDVVQTIQYGGESVSALPYEGYGEKVGVSSAGKWAVATKPGRLKVVKGNGEVVAVAAKGGAAGNWSGLKLSYNAKKGTFKGSFVAYAYADGRLKKYKFAVTGIVVNGEGVGVAECRKAGAALRAAVKSEK